MTKSIILDSYDNLIFASYHADIRKTIKQLKNIARQKYYHASSIFDIVTAKIILDNVDSYIISKDDPNTAYISI